MIILSILRSFVYKPIFFIVFYFGHIQVTFPIYIKYIDNHSFDSWKNENG